MKKIALVGTFEVKNFGDLLFPDLFKKLMSNAEIDLFSPTSGLKPFTEDTSVHSVEELDQLCASKRYDAIVIGGGDLIRADNNVASGYEESVIPSLSLWVMPILVGAQYKIPVIFNCPGVPFRFHENEKKYVRDLLSIVQYISVRDETSRNLLLECGVRNIRCVPDTLFMANEIIPQEQRDKLFNQLAKKYPYLQEHKFILFQHNNCISQEDIDILRDAVERITKETNFNVVFFPIGYVHDDKLSLGKIYNRKNPKEFFIRDELSPQEMLAILSHSSGYIGTSMHGGIISWSFKKPIIMLDRSGTVTKINGFQQHIGQLKSLIDYKQLSQRAQEVFMHDVISFSAKPSIDKKITKHFQRIMQEINAPTAQPNIQDVLMRDVCQDLQDSSKFFHAELIVYFNRGNGFSLGDRVIYPLDKLPKIDQNIVVPQDVQEVIIQICDLQCYIINDLQITGGKVKPADERERLYVGDNSFYTYNGFKVGITPTAQYLHITANMHVIDDDKANELAKICHQERESCRRLEQELDSIYSSRRWRLLEKLSFKKWGAK